MYAVVVVVVTVVVRVCDFIKCARKSVVVAVVNVDVGTRSFFTRENG